MAFEVLVSLAQPAMRAVEARAPEVAMNFLRDWDDCILGKDCRGTVIAMKFANTGGDSNEIMRVFFTGSTRVPRVATWSSTLSLIGGR